MLFLKRFRSDVNSIPRKWIEDLSERLSTKLKPSILPGREAQANIFGVAHEVLRPKRPQGDAIYELRSSSRMYDAEIFTNGNQLFIVSIEQKNSNSRRMVLFGSEIDRSETEEPDKASFSLMFSYVGPSIDWPMIVEVGAAINAIFEVLLLPVEFQSSKFTELKSEDRVSPQAPTQPEIDAANELRNRQTYTLALAVKSSGGLLIKDASKQLHGDTSQDISEVVKCLERHCLASIDIVVICKKSQAQITRVPSMSVLERMSHDGVRCACGRPIGDERVEEALIITEFGRRLLDGSHWLTLILVSELMKLGVPSDAILTDEIVGGDEVDCLVNISGELVFFELKDKDFNLGNAYSFGAKVGIIKPEHSIILTTHKIGNDAREHFIRARMSGKTGGLSSFALEKDNKVEIKYIEGLSNLATELQSLASSIYMADVVAILARILPLASIDANSLVQALARA